MIDVCVCNTNESARKMTREISAYKSVHFNRKFIRFEETRKETRGADDRPHQNGSINS